MYVWHNNLLELVDFNSFLIESDNNLKNNKNIKSFNNNEWKINKDLSCLEKTYVKLALKKVIDKITYNNTRDFILDRSISTNTQSKLELKYFGFDSHGNITKVFKNILGIDFKKLKKSCKTYEEITKIIESYNDDIKKCVDIINNKFYTYKLS